MKGPLSTIKPAATSCHQAEDPNYPRPNRQLVEKVDVEVENGTATGLSSPTSSNEEAEEDTYYPEGGLRAWLVTFGAWCAMFSALGLMNTIGSIQAYVSTHQLQQYSEGTVSWIFSVYVFLVFFCGLQIGPIFDAYGPRLLIFAGSVLLVLCMMLIGLCTAYWHFMVVFGIIGGFGSSLLFTPAIGAIAHFFMQRRSTATGLACTGGASGGIAFPLALRAMLPHLGFAWSTRILGFIYLFFVTLANILVRSRLPPKQKPSFKSVLPDYRIFYDRAFTLVTAGTFFMEFGLFVPVAYLTSYGFSNGIDNALSYHLISIMNAGSFFGRWLPGIWADKFGRFNAMILMLLLCMVTSFGLWLPARYSAHGGGTVPLVIVFAVIFGFASGSNISLTPVCVGELCDTRNYGRYYATCYTVVSIGTLTGIPIAGALIDAAGGEYWGLIVFTGLCYVASVACFIWVRVAKVGWKLSVVY